MLISGLHKEQLYDLYSSLEEKKPPGRPRRRWENNIKMDLQNLGWRGVNWIDLVQDRDRWRV
jgi:hypothetical protein